MKNLWEKSKSPSERVSKQFSECARKCTSYNYMGIKNHFAVKEVMSQSQSTS